MKKNVFRLSFLFVLIVILLVAITIFIRDNPLSDIYVNQYESEIVHNFKNNLPGLTGKHIKIAIIDSPIDSTHSELKGKIKETIVFTTDSNENTSTASSHGTQVAGIISAKDNGYGILGVAQETEIYSLVAIDSNGLGKIEDVCSALKWCLDNQMNVVNLSFSVKRDNQELEALINELNKKNTIIIASYNNRDSVSSYPAEYSNVIGVKSCDKTWFECKDGVVYAPGKNIITTIDKGGYACVDGNSMAAAYVSGLAAIYKEYCNNNGILFNKQIFLDFISKRKGKVN